METLNAILLAVFFFIMGAGLMGIVWYLQNTSKGAQGKAKTAHPADPNLVEVARMLRNLKTQDLVVEMDGKNIRSAAELTPAQLRKLNITAGVLNKWLGLPTPVASPAQAPITPPPAAQPEPITQPPPARITPAAVESLPSAFLAPLPVEPVMEVKPVSTELTDVVGRVLIPPTPPEPQFKSMAAQIDEVLQAKLVGTPLESRGITVGEVPAQGVVITLDGEKYPGVEAVPDEEVRNLIKQAVAEWEKKSRKGIR